MKVAHVVTFLDAKRSYGGPVSVALGIAEEQAKQGHRVHLVALSDSPTSMSNTLPASVQGQLFKVRKSESIMKFSGLVNVKALFWLFQNRNKFDIFHMHFSRDLFQVLSGFAIGRSRATIVLQPHGMITNSVTRKKWYQDIYDSVFIRPTIRRANSVVALQEIEKSALERIFNPRIVFVVPNGIIFNREFVHKNRNPKQVVFVSRLHPQKNPLLFVEVSQKMIRQGTSLHFAVGGPDGGLAKEVASRIEQFDSNQLSYLGALNNLQVQDLFKHAGVLVLPSEQDQYPMVVLEAISNGLQVILTSSSGLAPKIREHHLGFICEPNEKSVEAAIIEATSEPLDPQDIREAASGVFNISSVVESLAVIYKNQQPLYQSKSL